MMNQESNYNPAEEYNCVACTKPDNFDNLIQCDACNSWLHCSCSGIPPNFNIQGEFICNKCEINKQMNTCSSDSSDSGNTTIKPNIEVTSNITSQSISTDSVVTVNTMTTPIPSIGTQASNHINKFRQQNYVSSFVPSTSSTSNMIYSKNSNKNINEKGYEFLSQPYNIPENRDDFFRKQYTSRIMNNLVTNNLHPNYEQEFPESTHFNYSHPPTISNFFNSVHTIPPYRNRLTTDQLAARQVFDKIKLPTFDGDPENWLHFICNYEQSTIACGYSNVENLTRLSICLKGKALEHVRSCLCNPAMVPTAIETLRMIYGRPELIINKMRNQVLKHPAIKNMSQCIEFSIKVQHLCVAIESTSMSEYLYDYSLIQELVSKLPDNLKLDWAIHVESRKQNLSIFSIWLSRLAFLSSKVTLYEDNKTQQRFDKSSTSNNSSKHKSTTFLNVHEVKTTENEANDRDCTTKFTCPLCKVNEHHITECENFKKMNKNDRWLTQRQYSLCRFCLTKHNPRYCKNIIVCGIDGCTRKHNRLLHSKQPQNISVNNDNQVTTKTSEAIMSTHIVTQNPSILFRMIPVVLHGPTGVKIPILAFIDEGASISLIDKDLATQLQLDGPTEKLNLLWTNNVSRSEPQSQRVTVKINADGINKLFEIQLRTVDNLQLPQQELCSIKDYKHLKHLPIKTYDRDRPRVLLGLDNYHVVMPLESRGSENEQPLAIRSVLGWTVLGKTLRSSSDQTITQLLHINSIDSEVKNINLDPDKEMHDLVKKYFTMENITYENTRPPKILISESEERALKVLKETTKKIGKRFETGLLWKSENVHFPDNYNSALKRLIVFEKKLDKNPDLYKSVCEQLLEYEALGYIRKLHPNEPIQGTRVWYLPIFVVQNPNKPNKVRIVWDAAATTNDVSLNSKLLPGPDLINSLTSILHRFRQGRYAITGDIKQMFHQVRVKEADQSAQRFLWRYNKNEPPTIYVMQVLTFGSTCSPSSAIYVMRLNANEFKEEYPRAVLAITDNHYIDDYLDSLDDEIELLNVAIRVREIHEAGGFVMRNWLSNSSTILKKLGIPPSTTTKNINDSSSNKVLGIWWTLETDSLNFKINVNNIGKDLIDGTTVPTKRQVLRIIMLIFDPLGLVLFVMAYAKIILKDIWRTPTHWDEQIKPEQFQMWRTFCEVLLELPTISIPRCYTTLQNNKKYELHIFVDASENIFAAVAYWRITSGENVEVVLIGAKARASPMKPISIPRLELQAAVIGTRFAKSITESHTIPIERRIFWSDSSSVLYWINSSERKYTSYVAIRVGEILENTNIEEWRWVPSKFNAADDATKWTTPPKITSHHRWFTGPTFLNQNEDQWPKQKIIKPPEVDCEARIHVLIKKDILVTPEFTRFSNFNKLVRTQAFIIRYVNNLKQRNIKNRKIEKLKLKFDPISSIEFDKAQKILFKKCQEEMYSNEIRQLENNLNDLDKTSSLYKRSPFLDEDKILRVNGRINATNKLIRDTRQPIILPNPHDLTTLVVKHFHEKFLHQNHETVLNEIHRYYDVPRLRQLLKSIRAKCMQCRINNATPKPPIMSDLPPERLLAYSKPFTNIGIDYFGPFEIIIGRSVHKRWGVIFTCLATRAIHLDVAHSLNTDSCIMAIRRFVAVRGTPDKILSDCGTNFRGASQEFLKCIKEINNSKLQSYFHTISWNFNPPLSPHMGGIWERMIRIVKSNLIEILKNRRLTDETLQTCLYEVAHIINTRPLTHVTLESDDQPALTPNDFLNLSSTNEKPFGKFDEKQVNLSKSYKITQQIADSFWKRWLREYLPTLTKRTKWFTNQREITVGDIVIICDENLPRCTWPKGRVIAINRSRDGVVRSATVKTSKTEYTRPVVKLAVIEISKQTQEDPGQLTLGSVNKM